MRRLSKVLITTCIAGLMASATLTMRLQAEDAKENDIEKVMKTCHKAPKGEDPICKKAIDGKASPEELKKLIAGYKLLVDAKPPKGDAASWKEKTTKLLAAAESLEKGGAAGITKYKEAVNCKACHSAHKPD